MSENVICTVCDTPLSEEEIWSDITGSFVTDSGQVTREILCEFCFLNTLVLTEDPSGSLEDWRDFDELVDGTDMEYWDTMLDNV